MQRRSASSSTHTGHGITSIFTGLFHSSHRSTSATQPVQQATRQSAASIDVDSLSSYDADKEHIKVGLLARVSLPLN
jgi:hypothetical protein